MLWTNVIDVVRGLLFVLAHWCGGSFGLAIIIASCAARIVMLPLTLAAARRRLVRVRDKVVAPDRRMVLDALVQFPPAAALYTAVRGAGSAAGGFLWIANLAKPDRLIAMVAGLTTAGVAWAAMTAPAGGRVAQIAPLLLPAAVTFLILSHFSAGVAVYSITNSLIGAAERSVAARTLPAARPTSA